MPPEIVKELPSKAWKRMSQDRCEGNYLRKFWDGEGERLTSVEVKGQLARNLRPTFRSREPHFLLPPLPPGADPDKRKKLLEGGWCKRRHDWHRPGRLMLPGILCGSRPPEPWPAWNSNRVTSGSFSAQSDRPRPDVERVLPAPSGSHLSPALPPRGLVTPHEWHTVEGRKGRSEHTDCLPATTVTCRSLNV